MSNPLPATSDVLMYLFLRSISGVPHTEAQALRSRGDDCRENQHRTSMFFPSSSPAARFDRYVSIEMFRAGCVITTTVGRRSWPF
jgi:hypothetical protein